MLCIYMHWDICIYYFIQHVTSLACLNVKVLRIVTSYVCVMTEFI